MHTLIPGMRTIKTALAVFFCLLIDYFLLHTNGIYSSMAAVICLLPTYEQTKKAAKNRLIATVLGSAMGSLIMYLYTLFPDHYREARLRLIPLFIIVLILLLNLLHLEGAIILSCTIFLILALTPVMQLANIPRYALIRTLETFVGVSIAFLVNLLIFPPDEPSAQNKESFSPDPPLHV